MSAEALIIPKKRFVEGTIATTVFVAAASTGILVAREISKQRKIEQTLQRQEQSAGDGNYVTTLEEVMRRNG